MSEIREEVIDLGYNPIPNNCLRALNEETVKNQGQIWRIHKSDIDPFPSNPHAHNLEKKLTLDLSTGDLYIKRRLAGKMKKNDLIAIRSMLKNISPPELKI